MSMYDDSKSNSGNARHRYEVMGAEALMEIRERPVGTAPDDLFDRLMRRATCRDNQKPERRGTGFWLGTGLGAALAASLVAIALALGWLAPAENRAYDDSERFTVSLAEARVMDIAIELDSALVGASLTVELTGDVQIEGYGDSRSLSWSDDLDAGVNRLSLPLVATGTTGGQLLVRIAHPRSNRSWLIDLDTEA